MKECDPALMGFERYRTMTTQVDNVCSACTQKIHKLLLDVDGAKEEWYHVEGNTPLCDGAKPAEQPRLPLIME